MNRLKFIYYTLLRFLINPKFGRAIYNLSTIISDKQHQAFLDMYKITDEEFYKWVENKQPEQNHD